MITTGFPTGRWVVIGYELPRDRNVAGPARIYQAFVRKEIVFGPDRIEFPSCPVLGYRMRERNVEHEDRFDPLLPGSFDAKALGLKGKRFYEVRATGCLDEFYLSWDRTKIYLPMQGGLLLLEPVGRTALKKDPEPVATPTAVVPKIGFEKKSEGQDPR